MDVADVADAESAPSPGQPPSADHERVDWAVCCSGGGIRSASYCLGALQHLGANGLLRKAGLILSVSGGSYIAASRSLVANGLNDAEPFAYAPGTPEEQNLRNNTHYLIPNGATLLVGVLSLLVGVAVTFILALAPLFAATHAWGWLLRWQHVLCPGPMARCAPPGPWEASVTALTWWPAPAFGGAVTFVFFWWWWLTQAPRPRRRRDHGEAVAKAVGWAALVTTVVAVAMLAVPLLLAWWTRLPVGPFRTLVTDLGFGPGQTWSPAALGGVLAALIAIAQSCRVKLDQLHLTGAPGQAGQSRGREAAKPGLLARFAGWIRVYLLPWLASAVIVLIVVVAGLRWVKDGAAAGFSARQLLPVLIALAVMLATRVVADVNRMSMHDFYRWRLASVYAVRRKSAGEPRKGRVGAESSAGVTPDPSALLSSLSGDRPRLVVCATANINADREVPVGRGGMSLSFDPDHVILRGEDPARPAVASTRDYEDLVGRRRLTLFDVSAISGAAVSPLMGSMTRQAHRILLTMTNVRLGVWLPHPAVVRAAHCELQHQEPASPESADPCCEDWEKLHDRRRPRRKDRWWHALGLLLWYMWPLHLGWRKEIEGPGGAEARLWAYVLRARRDGRWLMRAIGGLFYHAMQPTLGMLWAEAAGHTSYRSTWVCVSDGGHYDNLGMVEALARGARNVVVLDASGDKADTWFTLGGTIALARSDAGVDIDLDPTAMAPRPAEGDCERRLRPGEVVQPWVSGTFTRDPDWAGAAGVGAEAAGSARAGAGAAVAGAAVGGARPGRWTGGGPLPQSGAIWVCKLGWWREAPWDVRAYARAHSEFPGRSTAQQLYDGAEFDAYRELGASTVTDAWEGGLSAAADLAAVQPRAVVPPQAAGRSPLRRRGSGR